MLWPPIQKHPKSWTVAPNLLNYDDTISSFSWDDIRGSWTVFPRARGSISLTKQSIVMPMGTVRPCGTAMAWERRCGPRVYLWRSQGAEQPLCQYSPGTWNRKGRYGFGSDWTHSRAVHCRAGNFQKHEHLLSPFLRFWSGADLSATEQRGCENSADDRKSLSEEGESVDGQVAQAQICASG